jgi:hypothetical protein
VSTIAYIILYIGSGLCDEVWCASMSITRINVRCVSQTKHTKDEKNLMDGDGYRRPHTCPCHMSMQQFHAACTYCVSRRHVYAALRCCLSVLHAHVNTACRCCIYVLLHLTYIHAACLCKCKHACPCYMSSISMSPVHAACPCSLSMLLVHAACAFRTCTCCMSLLSMLLAVAE